MNQRYNQRAFCVYNVLLSILPRNTIISCKMVQLRLSVVCVAGHNKDKDYRYIFIINGNKKIKSLLTQHKSINSKVHVDKNSESF